MDVLTFISQLVSTLAWPAVVVGAMLFLRRELPQLVASLRKLRFKEVEVEFGEAAEQVAIETSSAVPLPKPDTKLSGENEQDVEAQLNSIADLSPRAAVLEAWLRVEAAAVALIRKRGANAVGPTPGPLRLRQALLQTNVLTPSQLGVYQSLHKLRNEAVHVPDAQFTSTAVAKYIQAALAMAAYLEDVSE